MPDSNQPSEPGYDTDTLCKHCGHALYEFLHEMEEHNAAVVCPACGKKYVPAASAATPQAVTQHKQSSKNRASGKNKVQ
jgi:uncharacterized Zn finger protein (UPF0148 family)